MTPGPKWKRRPNLGGASGTFQPREGLGLPIRGEA